MTRAGLGSRRRTVDMGGTVSPLAPSQRGAFLFGVVNPVPSGEWCSRAAARVPAAHLPRLWHTDASLRGRCTTATRSGRATTPRASPSTLPTPRGLPRARRTGLRRAPRSHRTRLVGDRERHGLCAVRRTPVPSSGRPTSAPRCLPATSRVATSARRWASPAHRSLTSRGVRSSSWPTSSPVVSPPTCSSG